MYESLGDPIRRTRVLCTVFDYTAGGAWGVGRDEFGECSPICKNNKLNQTNFGLFSRLWERFSFANDQIPNDPLGFGHRVDLKTKTKPKPGSLSQIPNNVKNTMPACFSPIFYC